MTCVAQSAARNMHGGESPRFSMIPSMLARNFGVKWLGGTGVDQDIIGENYLGVEQGHVHEAEDTLTHVPGLVEGFSPYVLKRSPPALSIGQRCMEEGRTLFGVKITIHC